MPCPRTFRFPIEHVDLAVRLRQRNSCGTDQRTAALDVERRKLPLVQGAEPSAAMWQWQTRSLVPDPVYHVFVLCVWRLLSLLATWVLGRCRSGNLGLAIFSVFTIGADRSLKARFNLFAGINVWQEWL